jgi:hypothetical protein
MLALGGCTEWDPASEPAPTVEGGSPSPQPSGVIQLPQSDIPVRTVCDHGNRLYVVGYSSDVEVLIVPADPSCKETPQ